jgi:hypothetical protein
MRIENLGAAFNILKTISSKVKAKLDPKITELSEGLISSVHWESSIIWIKGGIWT